MILKTYLRQFYRYAMLAGLVSLCVAARASCDSRSPREAGRVAATAAHLEKGAAGMQFTVSTRNPEIIIGESLPVEVRLLNSGGSIIQVPSPDSPSVFEYMLRTAPGQAPVLSLSRRFAVAARADDTMPAPPLTMVPLQPGAGQTYQENIADYAVSPIPAGKYLLSVAWQSGTGRVESPGIPLTVTPPQVVTVDGVGAGLLLAHRNANSVTTLLQREQSAGLLADGTWHRRADIPAGVQVTGTASAARIEGGTGPRWFAWLQGEAAGAGAAEGKTLFLRVDPISTGLRAAALQGIGWQETNESALFAALGAGPKGGATLGLLIFTDNGQGQARLVPLAPAGLPLRWAVRLTPPVASGHYDIVMATQEGQMMKLIRQTVRSGKATAEAPVTLIERAEPLAALSFETLTGENKRDVVDALFGPMGDNARMTVMRLPLSGGAPIAEWRFTAPVTPDKKRPSAWALAQHTLVNPPVLAKSGDKLMARRAGGNSPWVTVAENAAQADHLRLEVVDDQVWAIWSDPVTGINFRQIQF